MAPAALNLGAPVPRSSPHRLLDGHDAFRRDSLVDDREFLRKLASEGQSPDAMYVGCSDARVVPELLTKSSPGRLFVVRNIANLVPPLEHADASVGAALEYAVGVLEVPHIIVCGHYGCGGVEAMLNGRERLAAFPSLQEWLRGMAPAVERAGAATLDPTQRWRRAVEENVLDQMVNLLTFPLVAEAVAAGRLDVHAWVYDLWTLELAVYEPASQIFLPAGELLREPETL